MNGGRQVLYLYGVVPGNQSLPAGEGTGLEAVAYGRLAAVVEPVSAAEFSPELLEQKLQCVDWITPLAQRHSFVLEQVLRHGPVVPARLCTLFSSADALTELLAQHAQRFEERLDWLQCRQEWGLKIFCDEGKLRSIIGASDPGVQALESAAVAGSPGQAYVLRKKRDSCVAELVSTWIEEVADEVLDTLAAMAVETRLRSLLSGAATGRHEAMVVNVALLVDTAGCPALHTAVSELDEHLRTEGFALELTGPWPAYSFCDEDRGPRELGDDAAASEEAR